MFIQKYKEHFYEWLFETKQGYNILLYGAGSKITQIEEFCKILPEKGYTVINGYESEISCRSIVNAIANTLNIPVKGKTLEFVETLATQIFCSKTQDFYILINSLDSVPAQSESIVRLLASMARIKHVHIVATVDKINCALMWDEELSGLNGFNWLWHHTPTFLPFALECSHDPDYDEIAAEIDEELAPLIHEPPRMGGIGTPSQDDEEPTKEPAKKGKKSTFPSLARVLASLTDNARQIFALVGREFISNTGSNVPERIFGSGRDLAEDRMGETCSGSQEGMPFQDLLRVCREEFYVSNDTALRTHLREFIDHGILKLKFDETGIERIYVCCKRDVIEDCLENYID